MPNPSMNSEMLDWLRLKLETTGVSVGDICEKWECNISTAYRYLQSTRKDVKGKVFVTFGPVGEKRYRLLNK